MGMLTATFWRETLAFQMPGAVQNYSSSKAAALFARRTYLLYVNTEKGRERRWRLFSTAPVVVVVIFSGTDVKCPCGERNELRVCSPNIVTALMTLIMMMAESPFFPVGVSQVNTSYMDRG